ncbi:DNA/RNA non-specific endonuclease [Colletotrichum orchidophilum]|uniref:Endonuclease n=1 Tax=Colletotrichum orchidophilum TaxID=1209926 RepID=A0A1G4BMU8_9PEZI|nr:DNA/RNA non-specific endonuclease [Colletotrichum orchidophilum]OHF02655.1 DNA/RNA non-specific endonuclease [Colletotrichum orchidophilum]
MSKTTSLALIAALSAGGGAALTATMYSMRSQKQPPTATTTTTTTTSLSTAPSVPVPGTQVFTNPNAAPLPPAAPSPLGGGGIPVPGGSPVNPAGLFEYGFPGPVADLANRQGLVSSYDRRTRNPHWVVEHITPASLAQRDGDRKHSTFVEDAAVPDKFQAKLKDYFRSGYDRGHQVPAADCKWSQKAMDDTFYLTNMCPQVGDGFNRDYWAHFEDFCRRLTTRYPSVRIVTGPLYLPKRDPVDGKWYTKYEVIGNPPNVAVPTHFYKVIFAEDGKPGGNVAIGAFVMPNAPIPNTKPLSEFEMPLEAVERAAGLEFASELAPQRRKRLCTEASCAIVVKEYADRQKQIGGGGGKGRGPSS